MRRRRILILLVALLGASVATGWAIRWPATPESSQGPLPQVAIDLKRASIVLRYHGQRQAEIHAEGVEISRDLRYATFVGDPTVVVFDRTRGPLEVHGRTITFDRMTSEVTVQGPVELVSVRSGRLTAGAAQWIQTAQQMVFERKVTATLGEQRIEAERLVITADQEVVDLDGDVDIAFRLSVRVP